MKFLLRRLVYLLSIHVLALLMMSLFRVVFYFSVQSQLTPDVVGRADYVATAFVRGIWFDNVIGCYITVLPLSLICLTTLFNDWRRWMYRAINVWCGTLYTLVFIACASNIPYFLYFSKPLNASIWNWAEYGGTTLGMIFGETSYYLYIFFFFLFTVAFGLGLYYLRRRALRSDLAQKVKRPVPQLIYMVLTSVALIGLCLFGIRGRTGYNPIKVSAAYFCTSPVLNNLGVNAMFALLNSTLDEMRPENQTLHLMADDAAVREVQRLYGRTGIEGISPIARQVQPQGEPTGQNVVIILMESMSAQLMEHFGNKGKLTPCLDSLYDHSLSFANCYSAGNHTNHGLYATLYSFPSIMYRNAMKGSNIPTYSGLPTVLKGQGYSTMFFMTHESQYDNMNAFFRTNGYDEIYAQEDYPRSKIVNHFGVADDYLFEYALPVLRKHAASKKPFLATLLTISNHPPYVVPTEFESPDLEPEEEIVRYADRCVGRFIAAAKREDWGKNTIFVILGDHGKLVGHANCELPESFNHIPLIFHGTTLPTEVRTQFAGQVDVAPTLLGLLRIPYVQNNFGIDLLNDAPRPAAFYTADKTIAARNTEHLYVYKAGDGTEYAYNLKDGTPTPTKMSSAHATLKQYVFSLLQTTEHMVQHGMTLDHKH